MKRAVGYTILAMLIWHCALGQDTTQYIGVIAGRKTITYKSADYSVQLYKKHKRSGISERTMYFDKDYYRFQYPGKGVTKLLRVNEVIATRKDDSVFCRRSYL